MRIAPINFDPDAFDAAMKDRQQHWLALEAARYGICQQYPDHSDRTGLNAKLSLIGRGFATDRATNLLGGGQGGD